MNEFLKMDIFFVVTTFVVLFVGAFAIVALYYIVRILRNVDHLSQNISEESDNVRGDITILRQRIRDEGMKVKHFADFFSSFAARNTARKTRQSKN